MNMWRRGDRRQSRDGQGWGKVYYPEHFPRDQELWVEVHSLGRSGRTWLRSSMGSHSTCLGKVRSGFFLVFLLKTNKQQTQNQQTKTKATQMRPLLG